jgi:hypothetical protein
MTVAQYERSEFFWLTSLPSIRLFAKGAVSQDEAILKTEDPFLSEVVRWWSDGQKRVRFRVHLRARKCRPVEKRPNRRPFADVIVSAILRVVPSSLDDPRQLPTKREN